MKNVLNLLLVVAIATTVLLASSVASYGQGEPYRCGAETTKGTPCKMRVKAAGLKCHHHAESGTVNATVGKNAGSAIIYTCGATTAKGTACKRRVKIQGHKCYSHQ
ncbi:MAG: hypothetical protein WAT79_08375 [Saprospiraceae bacterium]